jgi:hypothetical protein
MSMKSFPPTTVSFKNNFVTVFCTQPVEITQSYEESNKRTPTHQYQLGNKDVSSCTISALLKLSRSGRRRRKLLKSLREGGLGCSIILLEDFFLLCY